MDELPIDILIIIINFLSITDIINLVILYNRNIFEACRYLKNINLGLKFREYEKISILSFFHQPENLIIRNGSISKNIVCYYGSKNNWNLRKIIFNNCRIIDPDILYNFLIKQKKLEILELYLCTCIEMRHLDVINPNIKQLSLRNNNLTFKEIKHITKFKKLEKLDLSYSKYLFDVDINELKFDNLRILHITNTQMRMDDRFFQFLENLPKLEELNLDFVITTYQKFHRINQVCPRLKKFSFINSINMWLEDDAVLLLSKKWLCMETLILSYGLLEDEHIIDIVDNIPNIKKLNINQTSITDVGIIYITLKLKKLERLFINNNNITNISANHISTHLNNLKELDLSCTVINNYYIRKILKNNVKMEKLYIRECPNVEHRFLNFGVKKIII